MTEKPEADRVVTVAELLARHGQQVSGTTSRAHRRRAREGGISVAELTGEIPIIRVPAADAEPAGEPETDTAEPDTEPAAEDATESAAEVTGEVTADAPAEASAAAAPDEPAPAEPAEPRAYSALDAVADAGPQSPREFASTSAFPVMSPLAGSIMTSDAEGPAAAAEPIEEPVPAEAAPQKSALRQWLALGAQAVVGIAVGAALFIGFERLWDSLPYVALVLAILVILALVAVVRILRKTDDIVSILIAVVVGVIVTLGPLAFVLSTT